MLTDIDAARGVRDGLLPSPYHFGNHWLFALRVTGTGASYRTNGQEYVWRDPAIYLNDEFLARCNGVPVIAEHPQKGTLDSKEFASRIIGALVLPYLKDTEVWAVARIYNDDVARAMQEDQLSTSPSVVLAKSETETEELPDGSKLLIEGEPLLIDHLAVCSNGVWDKAGPPTGVALTTGAEQVDETMDDKEKKADTAGEEAEPMPVKDSVPGDETGGGAEEKAEPGAEGNDRLLSMMDTLCKTVDSLHKRIDSMETAAKPDATPAEKEDPKMAKPDAEKELPEKGLAKPDAYDAKADTAAIRAENEALKARLALIEKRMPRDISREEREQFSDAQARADSVYHLFGERAPASLQGESLHAYKVRLLSAMKKHSPKWLKVDLGKLDGDTLGIASEMIYADAASVGNSPAAAPVGQLREIKMRGAGGREYSEFRGDIDTWLSAFRIPRSVGRIVPKEMN